MIFQTVVLEKTLERPFGSKKIKRINPKENQSWILIERTENDMPILWPLDVKSQLIGIEGRRRRGRLRSTWLDGVTNSMDMSLCKVGDGEGQWSLECCSPWGCKELGMTKWLNNKQITCITLFQTLVISLILLKIVLIFVQLFTCFGEFKSAYQHDRTTAFIYGPLRNWTSTLKLSVIKDTLYYWTVS